eukprot:3615183-Pleurochrysis_carterae.AAC.6
MHADYLVDMRLEKGMRSSALRREVFRAADADSSGHIDIREFVDRFRALPHERDTFFWGERTKQHLLSRNDRLELAQRMGAPRRSQSEHPSWFESAVLSTSTARV